jgi:2-keto-3-deoxy-6-phosphogluconate aldolase
MIPMLKGRRALGCAVLILVLAFSAAAAHAGSDPWFSGNLTFEQAVASANAHSITYIQGVGTANGFCIAKDTGFAGLGNTTGGTAGVQTCATSGGFASRSENGACCFHGWIGNPVGGTINIHPSTRYDF